MCGHVGIAGRLEFRDEALMKRLFVFDYFRGPDSTGLAAFRHTGDVKIAKIASNPIELFDMKRFGDALSGVQSKVFLGHNRLATKGKVNTANAHPYEYKHIVGAHNGTLHPGSWRALQDKLGYDTEVDSQAIFACIAEFGIEETMSLMEGAWALVWFDTEKRTINFLRNKERPLWYAFDSDMKKIFWASEWPMIDAATAMASANQGYKMYKNDGGFAYFPFKEDVLYTHKLSDLQSGYQDFESGEVKTLKGKEHAPVVVNAPFQGTTHGTVTNIGTTYTNRQGQAGGATSSTTPSTTQSTTAHGTTGESSKSRGSSSGVPITLFTSESTPFGRYLTSSEFDNLAAGGCSWCHNVVDYSDLGVTVFLKEEAVLCPVCSRGSNDTTRLHLKQRSM